MKQVNLPLMEISTSLNKALTHLRKSKRVEAGTRYSIGNHYPAEMESRPRITESRTLRSAWVFIPCILWQSFIRDTDAIAFAQLKLPIQGPPLEVNGRHSDARYGPEESFSRVAGNDLWVGRPTTGSDLQPLEGK